MEVIETPIPYVIGVSRDMWERHFLINLDDMNYDQFFLENVLIFDVERDFL